MFKQEFPKRDRSEMVSSLIGALTTSVYSSNCIHQQNQLSADPLHDQHCFCREQHFQSQPKGYDSERMVSSSIGVLTSSDYTLNSSLLFPSLPTSRSAFDTPVVDRMNINNFINH